MSPVRIGIVVSGRVQGVGFRYFTHRAALRNGLTGWVRNSDDGSVIMEVQGSVLAVEQFKATVNEGPVLARVTKITVTEMLLDPIETEFTVRH